MHSFFFCAATLICWLLPLEPFAYEVLPPLSADRPDATESPYTVPAGHWQIEADAVVYERDSKIPGSPRESRELWSFGNANLKYGLNDRLDIQMIVEPYRRERIDLDQGESTTQEGFGDITLRLKWRLDRESSQGVAWALLPYLKIPTAERPLGNGAMEGGFVVPFSQELSDTWSLGFQAGAEWRRADSEARYSYSFTPTATIVLAQALTPVFGIFYEVAAAVDTEASSDAWEISFNAGLTYSLSPNTQLDFGAFVGVTRAAPDVTLFTGYSRRW